MRNPAISSIVLVAIVLSSTHAIAQAPSPAKPATTSADASARAEAKAMGLAALKLYEEHKWSEAYEQFVTANATVHAPPFVLYMARCKRELGQWVKASTLYKQVASEPLEPTAPQQFVGAQMDAANELQALALRIPSVSISVDGAVGEAVQITLDGASVTSVTVPLRVDPGKHEIVVRSSHGLTVTKVVDIPEGKHQDVRLALPAPKQPKPPCKGVDCESLEKPAKPSSASGAWIAFGMFGGISVGTGIVALATYFPTVDAAEGRGCGANCKNEFESSAAILQGLTWTSAVTGGVAVGTILYATLRGSSSSGPKQAGRVSIRVVPTVGGGVATVTW